MVGCLYAGGREATRAEGIKKGARSGVKGTPRPRLGRRKLAASLGPHPDCRNPGARQGARRPRQRHCLLEGCERLFQPTVPQARFCSPECRAEARRWRRRGASREYRQTSNGREKRQAQCQRYRCRCAERRQAAATHAQETIPTVTDPACGVSHWDARASAQPTARIFFAAIVPAAISTSPGPGAVPASGFAAPPAVRRCAGLSSGNGSGGSDPSRCSIGTATRPPAGPELVGSYRLRPLAGIEIHRPQKEEGAEGSGTTLGPPLPFSDPQTESGRWILPRRSGRSRPPR